MPKKFQGENTKSAVARARRAEKHADDKMKKEKEADDLYWKEDDKLINKKFQRKEDKERKRLEEVERKLENRRIADEESKEVETVVKATKLTVHELQIQREEREAILKQEQEHKNDNVVVNDPIVENLNRESADVVSGSGMDAALAAITMSDTGGGVDLHPERRMAAAFRVFEEQEMPKLKKEYPTFRLSQLKQLLRKEWLKHPQNPLNRGSQ